MAASATSQQTPAVDQPKHPLHALTTYELAYYRRRLENAIAYLGKQDPVPAIRADMQAALDRVIAEQDDRARIAAADPRAPPDRRLRAGGPVDLAPGQS